MDVVCRMTSALVLRSAAGGVPLVDLHHMLVHMVTVGMMEVSPMEIIDMAVVNNGDVAAVGTVNVRVGTVLIAVHVTPNWVSSYRQWRQLHDHTTIAGPQQSAILAVDYDCCTSLQVSVPLRSLPYRPLVRQAPTAMKPQTRAAMSPQTHHPAFPHGGSRAFEDAVRPHVSVLHLTASWTLRSDDLAWDAVQETLIRAWGYGTLPEDPRGVLLRLVQRSCLHILRCARRRHDHEQSACVAVPEICCSLDPAEDISRREELDVVLHAMGKLTDEHRESLSLVASRGLSYRDAALELGVPIGTIRSRIARARGELRNLLAHSLDRPSSC